MVGPDLGSSTCRQKVNLCAVFICSLQDTVLSNNIRILKLLVAVPGSFGQRQLDLALFAAAKHGKNL